MTRRPVSRRTVLMLLAAAAVITLLVAGVTAMLAGNVRSPMPQQTGPAVFSPDGSHTHTYTSSAPPTGVTTPPTGAPPVTPPPATLAPLPPNTSIGTGAMATAWGEAILTALGAPLNTANVSSMLAWFAAEDDNQPQGHNADGVGQNNPLDVTGDSGTFTGTIGSEPSGAGPGFPGNLNFDTPVHGVAAMAQVIRNYSAIHAALTSGKGLIGNAAVSANLSEWSGGGYSSLS
jgi:hypothetical protein